MSPLLLGILNSQAAAGGAGAFDWLETSRPTGTGTLTITGLGAYSDYQHLQIRMLAESDFTNNLYNVNVRFNNDTSTIYSGNYMYAQSGNTWGGSAFVSSNDFSIRQILSPKFNSYAGASIFEIYDFASTTKAKTLKALSGAATYQNKITWQSGLYNSTNAITSITFISQSGNFLSNTRFAIYGWK